MRFYDNTIITNGGHLAAVLSLTGQDGAPAAGEGGGECISDGADEGAEKSRSGAAILSLEKKTCSFASHMIRNSHSNGIKTMLFSFLTSSLYSICMIGEATPYQKILRG